MEICGSSAWRSVLQFVGLCSDLCYDSWDRGFMGRGLWILDFGCGRGPWVMVVVLVLPWCWVSIFFLGCCGFLFGFCFCLLGCRKDSDSESSSASGLDAWSPRT